MKTRNQTDPSGEHILQKSRNAWLFPLAMIFLILQTFPLCAWESTFFDYFDNSTSARAAALGGLHSALADDPTVLFSNPAGLRSVKPQFSLGEATFSFYESAAEIAGEGLGAGGGSSADRRGIISLWGPLNLTYVGKGKGYGIFSSTNIYVHTWGPSPSARQALEENLVLIVARAFRIRLPERWQSTLDIGFSLAGFATARGVSETDIREYLQSSISLQEVLANTGLFQRAMGAGVDFGVLYSFKDIFAFGLAGRNLSVVEIRDFATLQGFLNGESSSPWYNVLPLDLSAGILFRPPLGRLSWFFSDLMFMADYHNIFDFLIYPPGATHPLLHIGLGLEMKLLEIVSLRAGFYQLLPSFGFGLDLRTFTLNLAYYGRELSQEPGGYPVFCYAAGLQFKY